jgi:hypothetical protein
LGELGFRVCSTMAMAAWWRSGTAKTANGGVSSDGEVTNSFPVLL